MSNPSISSWTAWLEEEEEEENSLKSLYIIIHKIFEAGPR